MTTKREYHVHTRKYVGFEQALVFAVTRDDEKCTLELHEIYIVTNVNGNEIKNCIRLEDAFSIIADTPDGNIIDEHLPQMADILDSVLTDESRVDIENRVIDSKILDMNTQRLILAADRATSTHPTLSIEDIVNEKLRDNNS